ncbi:MAG: GxxExxY protein [Chloroflexi bacterium]|nr:GxxExxY protein [Chloroflexota bacterium]MYF79119.1 GxxExxY protein [Chloroflexota bacterium]
MLPRGYEHSGLTGAVIGCAMEVHSVLGAGFQEVVYQRALASEMARAGIEFGREVEMTIMYKGLQVGVRRVDFLVGGVLTVEIKAVGQLEKAHWAQAMNYVEAYNVELGLLLNFGAGRLEFNRLVNNRYSPALRPDNGR